jgi:hypothetical protein
MRVSAFQFDGHCGRGLVEADAFASCGSFNRALMNALPALAPADMKLTEAPSFRGFPLYDADLQAEGFPPDVTALADAIRAADAVIIITPEYNYSIPGTLRRGGEPQASELHPS